MARRTAAALALVAGVLLLLANFQGGSLLLDLGDRLAREFLDPVAAEAVHLVFTVLLFIAGLGGLAVVVGGVQFAKGRKRTGRLLVGLGAGLGVLGLLVLLVLSLASGQALAFLGWLLGPAGLGVLLSILARREAR